MERERSLKQSNRISREGKVLLIIHTLFSVCITLSNTFVNIYLYRITSDLKYLAVYNIIVYIFVPIGFVISGYLARKRGTVYCFRAGIVFYIIYYLNILILKDNVGVFLPLIAIFSGLAMGFYYYGYNKLTYDVTNEVNRGYYLGISGAIGSITATLAPVLSGFIIVRYTGMSGYYMLFIISFILFLICIFLSKGLKNEVVKGEFNIKITLFKHGYTPWNKLMISNILYGFKDGAMVYLLNILVFIIMGDELKMGKYTTFINILGIVSSYLVGKFYKRKKASIWFGFAAISVFISTGLLVFLNNKIGLIINGVVTAIFTICWNVPYNEIIYHMANKASKRENNLGDFLIVREIPLALGRIVGFLTYILISLYFVGEVPIRIILPILAAVGVINYLYIRKIVEAREK